MISGVIFDMDNTLVYPTLDFDYISRGVKDFLISSGLPASEVENMSPLLESLRSLKATYPELYEDAMRILIERELERARSSVIPREVVDTLNILKSMGMRMAVITRNCREATEIAMDGIKEYFMAIITRDDVERPKPHPEHILKGVRAIGLSPQRCLCVGDYEFDIIAGRRAGCITVGINIEADYTISSIAELPGIITEVNTKI